MGLQGNDEDVRFAHAAAEQLAGSLRAAASTLEQQRGPRAAWQQQASEEFRGRYAEVFLRSARTAAADAAELAAALRDAAAKVEELARLAREEQAAREAARRWYRERQERDLLDKAHDLVFGDDPPPAPARSGPRLATAAPSPGARGQ